VVIFSRCRRVSLDGLTQGFNSPKHYLLLTPRKRQGYERQGEKQRRKVGFFLKARLLACTIGSLAAVLGSSLSSAFTGSGVRSLQQRFLVFAVIFPPLGIENNPIFLSPQTNDLARGQLALNTPAAGRSAPRMWMLTCVLGLPRTCSWNGILMLQYVVQLDFLAIKSHFGTLYSIFFPFGCSRLASTA
jgi:hypothetical protein